MHTYLFSITRLVGLLAQCNLALSYIWNNIYIPKLRMCNCLYLKFWKLKMPLIMVCTHQMIKERNFSAIWGEGIYVEHTPSIFQHLYIIYIFCVSIHLFEKLFSLNLFQKCFPIQLFWILLFFLDMEWGWLIWGDSFFGYLYFCFAEFQNTWTRVII